jgi:hypothetical protein
VCIHSDDDVDLVVGKRAWFVRVELPLKARKVLAASD